MNLQFFKQWTAIDWATDTPTVKTKVVQNRFEVSKQTDIYWKPYVLIFTIYVRASHAVSMLLILLTVSLK